MTDRKKDHIELAFHSQMDQALVDTRFYYEPLLCAHPDEVLPEFKFLGKRLRTPIWVSSMTGGTGEARTINRNLARACREFRMGMGLGSCRVLMENDRFLPDFDVRSEIGDDLPLYANLGIRQVEQIVIHDQVHRIDELLTRLRADGLIVHVNPLQEWLQPEGDVIQYPPIETIRELLLRLDAKVIVKEVGQGMGPESLSALMELPLEAIELAAFGGTNFARVEMMRNPEQPMQLLDPLTRIGHSAVDMVNLINTQVEEGQDMECNQVIVSGGIRNFLDGYYLTEKCQVPSIYGQASELLKYARNSYEDLRAYLDIQTKGLLMARAYLRIREY